MWVNKVIKKEDMKRSLLLVCAVFAYVHAQARCSCSKTSKPVCQPLPPCAPIAVEYTLPPQSAVALPTCNCPALPSLPVSAQVLPAISAPPFDLGILGISPLGMINPFLPVASPISALAPTVSSLYPPINPCNCACKYLKKIPIPPPCL